MICCTVAALASDPWCRFINSTGVTICGQHLRQQMKGCACTQGFGFARLLLGCWVTCSMFKCDGSLGGGLCSYSSFLLHGWANTFCSGFRIPYHVYLGGSSSVVRDEQLDCASGPFSRNQTQVPVSHAAPFVLLLGHVLHVVCGEITPWFLVRFCTCPTVSYGKGCAEFNICQVTSAWLNLSPTCNRGCSLGLFWNKVKSVADRRKVLLAMMSYVCSGHQCILARS